MTRQTYSAYIKYVLGRSVVAMFLALGILLFASLWIADNAMSEFTLVQLCRGAEMGEEAITRWRIHRAIPKLLNIHAALVLRSKDRTAKDYIESGNVEFLNRRNKVWRAVQRAEVITHNPVARNYIDGHLLSGDRWTTESTGG